MEAMKRRRRKTLDFGDGRCTHGRRQSKFEYAWGSRRMAHSLRLWFIVTRDTLQSHLDNKTYRGL